VTQEPIQRIQIYAVGLLDEAVPEGGNIQDPFGRPMMIFLNHLLQDVAAVIMGDLSYRVKWEKSVCREELLEVPLKAVCGVLSLFVKIVLPFH
jgi:hypothetical protein